MKNISRHGDLLIEETKVPSGLVFKKMDSFVLAIGEHTNHSHVLVGDIQIARDGDDIYFKVGNGGAKVTHEEHKTIEIERGIYWVRHEQEYDYFEKQMKQVRD